MSVDFGSPSQRKSMSGCALVVQQKEKVNAKNGFLAIDEFRSLHPAVETKKGLLK